MPDPHTAAIHGVPKALPAEIPGLLSRSSGQLRGRLGVNQFYLRGLMHKLEDTVDWIEIKSPPDDGRRCLSTTTLAGKEALVGL